MTWADVIMDMPADRKIRPFKNAKCQCCGNVNPNMISVGPMVLCESCKELWFGDANEYDPKSARYKCLLDNYFGKEPRRCPN